MPVCCTKCTCKTNTEYLSYHAHVCSHRPFQFLRIIHHHQPWEKTFTFHPLLMIQFQKESEGKYDITFNQYSTTWEPAGKNKQRKQSHIIELGQWLSESVSSGEQNFAVISIQLRALFFPSFRGRSVIFSVYSQSLTVFDFQNAIR